jgi:hypothetical protein
VVAVVRPSKAQWRRRPRSRQCGQTRSSARIASNSNLFRDAES